MFFLNKIKNLTTATMQLIIAVYTGNIFVDLDKSAVVVTSDVHRGQLSNWAAGPKYS